MPWRQLSLLLLLLSHAAAVQHERGPRNSTIRRQTANYHKKMDDMNLPTSRNSAVSPYWTTASADRVVTLPFNASLLRHPVPQVIESKICNFEIRLGPYVGYNSMLWILSVFFRNKSSWPKQQRTLLISSVSDCLRWIWCQYSHSLVYKRIEWSKVDSLSTNCTAPTGKTWLCHKVNNFVACIWSC